MQALMGSENPKIIDRKCSNHSLRLVDLNPNNILST
jgi:hypothetical protein